MFSFDFSGAPISLYLLIVNVMVSGYALLADASLVDKLSLRVDRIFGQKEWYRIVTAGFVHVGLAHLLFNIITLYFFGPFLEQLIGSWRFGVLYFGAMLTAHILALVWNRKNPRYAAVGASGAVSGIVFAYCIFFPFQMLYIFFAIPMPAILFAVLYVGGSIYAMKQAQAQGVRGGIAHEAHLGGALGGILLTFALVPRALGLFLSHFGF